MISAGVEGRLPYMTYSEPWSRNPPKQQSEFLRPAPKLLPPATRSYNGVPTATTYPNGTRIAPSRPISKYPSPPPSAIPVNLTQPKEEIKEDPLSPYSPYRLFPHSPQYTPFPYPSLCQPYMMRTPTFPPTPLSPQEIYSPATPTASSTATFLHPPSTFSPPSSMAKASQGSILRGDKRTSPIISTAAGLSQVPHSPLPQSPSFKVPSGREGSMKHRLLTSSMPLDLQKSSDGGRKRLAATISPPRSPKKSLNNNTVPANFQKGQMIQLANGEFKRIEEMRTEDFIQSAEKNPELRLAESTVVKIDEGKDGHVTITLTYDQRRAQVEVDSTPEQPYFVMGHGWASCNQDRTMQCYGLKVHRLQFPVPSSQSTCLCRYHQPSRVIVGDVMVSVTPRETPPSTTIASRSTTIMTTATTTAMSARQYSGNASSSTVTNSTNSHILSNHFAPPVSSPLNHHRPLSVSSPQNQHRPLSVSSPQNHHRPLSVSSPQNHHRPLSVSSPQQNHHGPMSVSSSLNHHLRPLCVSSPQQNHHGPMSVSSPLNHHIRPMSHSPPKSVRSPDYVAQQQINYYASAQMTPLQLDAESRKRRWSAPDAIEEEELAKRGRVE